MDMTMKERMAGVYKNCVTHEESTIRSLKDDPSFAAEYLSAVFEDGEQDEIMTALRRVSEAYGGVTQLASLANLNPNTLYRTLSQRGNPELKSFLAILSALGFRLSVTPKETKNPLHAKQAQPHT
jgi:probable addiction module antidote protein